MKVKLLAAVLVVSFFLAAFTVQLTRTHASQPPIAIIGGVMNANATSHITILSVPGSRSGMVIFYRCSTGLIRTVYPNHNANSLGRYTWQWDSGAPCQTGGYALVQVNSHVGFGYITAQKRFNIQPLFVPTPVPPSPTPAPIPTTPITGVNGNPWGYDFDSSGNLIFSPPGDFCGQYFSCVSSFWTSANGYVAECANGVYTHSGGVRGACSRDGGVLQALYSH